MEPHIHLERREQVYAGDEPCAGALSLIKCGFLEKARKLLAGLVKDGHQDEETLGILGRVYKDMWLIAGGGSPADNRLLLSRALYLQAFRKSRGYYSGINAAVGPSVPAERSSRSAGSTCRRGSSSTSSKG